jgi:hypothetical protein
MNGAILGYSSHQLGLSRLHKGAAFGSRHVGACEVMPAPMPKKARRCPGSPDVEPFDDPSATPSCGQLLPFLGRSSAVNGTAEPRPGGSRSERCSERYSSLLRCGEVLYLFSRVELPRLAGGGDARGLHDDRWGTLVRSSVAGSARGSPGLLSQLSEPRLAMPAEWNMSSNAGFVCLDDGSVAAYGGRRKARYPKHPYCEAGILRSVGRPDGASGLSWEAPQLVHSGATGPAAPARAHPRSAPVRRSRHGGTGTISAFVVGR